MVRGCLATSVAIHHMNDRKGFGMKPERIVWMLCKDAGGTKGVSAVYPHLIKMGFTVRVIANGVAPRFLGDIEHRWDEVGEHQATGIMAQSERPDIVITAMDAPGGAGFKVVSALQREGFSGKIVALMDYPVSSALRGEWISTRPDFITAGDKVDAEVIARAWPDFDRTRIIVTGYSAFDRFVGENVLAKRREIRRMLGLERGVILISILTDIGTTVLMVEDFMGSLSGLDVNVKVAIRSHPAMRDVAPDEYRELMGAIAPFSDRIVETMHLPTDDVVAASNLMVAAYSTAIGESGARKIPNINFAFPYMAEWYDKATGGIAPIFPWTAQGVCAEAHNREELATLLGEAISGNLRRRLLPQQKKHLRLDGRNAQRVAEFICNL